VVYFIVFVLIEIVTLVPIILVQLVKLLIVLPIVGLVAAVIVPAVVRDPRRRVPAYLAFLVLGVVLAYVIFLGPLLHGWTPLLGWPLGFVALFLGGLLVVAALGLLAATRARKVSRGK
jgi:hypothetical protein